MGNYGDVVFEKKKTGPNKFNVEYKLKERSISNTPLTEEEMEVIKDIKSIDEIVPRVTSDEQKAFIEQAWINGEAEETNADADAESEFDDDIPF